MIQDPHDKPEVKEDEDYSTEYKPSDEDRETLRYVEKHFKKAKQWRTHYDKKWMNFYKMFRGQQWPEQRPSYRHSEVINMVFQAIQTYVPLMTDTRPRWEFQAQEPQDKEFAELMNQIAEADWIKNNWLMRLTENVYDSHIYGTGLGSMTYNPEAKPFEGDIDFSSEDIFYFYPDPQAEDVNKRKGRYTICAKPVEISTIKREYPELGQYVKSDITDALKAEKTELDPAYQMRYPVDATGAMAGPGYGIEGILDSKVLKKIMYCFSDETEETRDDRGEVIEKKLKYPQGRKIVTAGGVVLENGPIPYDDQLFPYARLVNYVLPREFWGISEVEQLESPQKIFNKLISFTLDVLTLCGNPIWVIDHESGIDTDNLINSPGMVVEKNKGSEVRRESGVQLQPYVLQIVDRMREYFQGIHGAMDAAPPPGVTAAAAIADIQEAAQMRVRLKARNMDAYLQDLGQMYFSRVMQYRTAPAVVRLTGNQNAQKYFKFHVKQTVNEVGEPMYDTAGNPMRTAVVQDLTNGQGVPREMPIVGRLDVKVSTGSAMPFMKAQKSREAKELFQLGLIDQEEVLKTVEWPNYQVLMDRMQATAQQAAQAEQQAAQAQQMQAAQAQQMQAASTQPPV